jgi:hypothetical protein
MKLLTNVEFKEKALDRHGDKYDYTTTLYVNSSNKVSIVCRRHGVFLQRASSHLDGDGCPKCGNEEKVGRIPNDTQQFIEKSRFIHGHKYDYSKTVYSKSNQKVTIICPIHNEFRQIPSSHLRGCGCRLCFLTQRSSKMELEWLNSLNINVVIGKQIGKFSVDGFDPLTNTIYEFLGDFWHGKIKDLKTFNYDSVTKYMYTFYRFNELSKLGYNINYIWEDEWMKSKKNKTTPILHTFQPWIQESELTNG